MRSTKVREPDSLTADTGPGDLDTVVPARLTDVVVEFTSAQGTQRVLDGLSLECHSPEFLVLIGRSGCGKTTVLNLLAGLVSPTEGRVTVLGKPPKMARSDLSYMFARDALMPWRTARANVELGLEVRGHLSRRERRAVATEALERLGLAPALHKYPWQLSQGMRQRVALARTMVLEPQLILMDEPFAALDAQTKIAARAEFLKMWERNPRAVVFVTHDLQEALLMGDRILIMADGGISREVKVPFPHPRAPEELPFTEQFRVMERDLSAELR